MTKVVGAFRSSVLPGTWGCLDCVWRSCKETGHRVKYNWAIFFLSRADLTDAFHQRGDGVILKIDTGVFICHVFKKLVDVVPELRAGVSVNINIIHAE